MSEAKSILELLPKGQFVINKPNGFLKGRFSMFMLDRFCEAKGIENYLTLLEKIMVGMKLGDYAELIQMAIEDYYRKDYSIAEITKADICDLIDELLGGVAGEDFGKLIRHAIGRVADVKKIEEAAAKTMTTAEAEEKKSELNPDLNGSSSGNNATGQD